MSKQTKITIEDEIKNSNLSEDMKKHTLNFIAFLIENAFSVETEDDGNGWQIIYMSECVGHMNFVRFGIWLGTCDFGNGYSTDNDLKEIAWSHVRACEYDTSNGKQCGCGKQPGFNKTIVGKEYKNLCFVYLEFMNPDAKKLENIKNLMLLFKQNKYNMGGRI